MKTWEKNDYQEHLSEKPQRTSQDAKMKQIKLITNPKNLQRKDNVTCGGKRRRNQRKNKKVKNGCENE